MIASGFNNACYRNQKAEVSSSKSAKQRQEIQLSYVVLNFKVIYMQSIDVLYPQPTDEWSSSPQYIIRFTTSNLMHFGLRESAQYVQPLSNTLLNPRRRRRTPAKGKMFAQPGTIYSFGIIETPLFIISCNKGNIAKSSHSTVKCEFTYFLLLKFSRFLVLNLQ